MRVGEFLTEIVHLEPDWDEELKCASCGAAILELHSRGAPADMLGVERVQWADGNAATGVDDIICPRCGSRSPIARPHLREPLPPNA